MRKKLSPPQKSFVARMITNDQFRFRFHSSFASPLKKISTKPTHNDEAIEAEKSSHETSQESSDDRNLSDLIQTNLGKLLNVNSNKLRITTKMQKIPMITQDQKDAKDINDNTNDNNKDAKDINDNTNDNTNDNNKDAKDINDNTNDRLDELRTIVSAVLS